MVVDLTLLEADETEAAAAARDETDQRLGYSALPAAEDEEEESRMFRRIRNMRRSTTLVAQQRQ
jgi:hypothetical protein